MSNEPYVRDYSEQGFWQKAHSGLKSAGAKVLRLALKLYFSAQDSDTPVWAKTAIYSALGYFICTIDAIPDLTPIVGFSDDLGALTLALATVAIYVKSEHVQAADDQIARWFGDASEADEQIPDVPEGSE
jgi:uncharacterized membrane protein YkvA (DUF1232 family)